eukprot:COSAG02_NODE_392_length_23227_cov_30.763620_10_plen_64_part_00
MGFVVMELCRRNCTGFPVIPLVIRHPGRVRNSSHYCIDSVFTVELESFGNRPVVRCRSIARWP